MRGTALKVLERFGEAADSFEITGALVPTDADAHFLHAECIQLAGGNVQAAVDAYNKSILIESDNAEAHAKMGLALAELDQNRDSVSHLRKAINLNPQLYGEKYAATLKEIALIADAEADLEGAADEAAEAAHGGAAAEL